MIVREEIKVINLKEKKTMLQFLFYDVNENLESISIYCESKDEARAMCRQVFMKNAEILLEEPISTMEMEAELINAELNKENNFNYCGVKRIQAIISEGTIIEAEGKSIDDVINKLYE